MIETKHAQHVSVRYYIHMTTQTATLQDISARFSSLMVTSVLVRVDAEITEITSKY